MKDNCASAGLASFLADKVTQPFCSYTPITIIRRISRAGLSVQKVYFYHRIFVRIFFRQLLTLQLNLKGVSPENEPKNKNKQTNEETLNLWIDLENLKFSETHIIAICLPNVRKNIFMMLFHKILQIVRAL